MRFRAYAQLILVLFLAAQSGVSHSRRGRAEHTSAQQEAAETGSDVRWIDTHTHPLGGPGRRESVFSAERLNQVIAIHERRGVERALLLLPPSPRAAPAALETQLIQAVKSRPEHFAFLGGGLQALIQEAIESNMVSPELRGRFEAKAVELARAGAVGFGEMTALHFSFAEFHPYVEARPDHPLFLLLADLAAKYDVPLDLHMEAVTKDMATPGRLLQRSSLNPPTVRENVSAFERLLARNRKARIVWAHIGWDNTGDMTVALLRRLLEAHPNLYLQLRIPTVPGTFPQNNPLDRDGKLRPEWLDLIDSFPERLVLGSDTFMARPDFEEGLRLTASLLQQLPPKLARKVGYENATRLYRLR